MILLALLLATADPGRALALRVHAFYAHTKDFSAPGTNVVGGRSPPFGDLNASVLVLDPVAGAWSTTASLPVPRDYPGAALGSDGRIYVIGGGPDLLGTVQVYDPVGRVWTSGAGLPTPRTEIAAAAAGDGRIYAIGGDNGRPLTTVEAYSPVANAWTPVTPLAVPRAGEGAASMFGRIFIAGGDDAGLTGGALAEQFSAATMRWTSLPELGTPRRLGATVAGPDGRLFAIGGVTAGNVITGSVEAFRPAAPVQVAIDIQPGDPQSRIDLSASGYVRVALLSGRTYDINHVEGSSLRFAGAPPIELRGGAHPGEHSFDERVLHGNMRDLNGDKKPDRIFRFPISALAISVGQPGACLFGINDHDHTRTEVEACGPVSTGGMPRTWSPIALMNIGHFTGVMAADQLGRGYVVGGWDAVQTETAAVERYDAAMNSWSLLAPMAQVRSGLGAAFGTDGRLYAAGGFDGANGLSSAEVYDPGANTWSPLPPMPNLHDETAMGAATDGRIFVFGGHNEIVPNAIVDAYNPATGSWSAATSMPGTRFDHAVVRAPDGEILVFGGWDSFTSTVPTTTAWAFNPATGTWRTVAPLPAPRSSAAAAVDANGIVYVIGGDDGTTTVNTVFAYNPSTNSWSQVAGMGSAREGEGAALIADGRVVAAGGFDGALFVKTAEAFARP